MTYDEINLISNYLSLNNDNSLYKIINNIFLNNSDISELKSKIANNEKVSFINQSSNDTLNFNTLIFCKFTKENIFECLFNINQHFYDYKIGENSYHNYILLNELNKLGFKFKASDEKNKQINQDNTKLSGHDGMHFFPHCPVKLIVSNYEKFGETLVIGINDPQLIQIPKMSIINPNDLKFKNIYVGKIYNNIEPLFIKELFKYCSEDKFNFKKLLRTRKNNQNNIFDVLIDNFKKIEYAKTNLSTLLNCNTIEELIKEINLNYMMFAPVEYKDTIDFLSSAKEIYLDLLNNNNIFPVEEFCSALDEICPGKLNIFDEKYQIEQFRETYGGKEFKEKFLNNLAKTAEGLTFSDIKKILNNGKIKPRIKLTIQEKLCEEILDYNSNHKTKQIPILLLINDFKNLNNDDFKKLRQIIGEYMNGNTKYLYDYLVIQENLDKIIEKIDIEKSDKKVSLDQKIEKATLDYKEEKQGITQQNKENLNR